MNLVLLGVNHRTAPIALRERIAIGREELGAATRSLASLEGVREAMLLSTCNRVELLAAVESQTSSKQDAGLAEFLQTRFSLEADHLSPHLYLHRDHAAVRHVFRVAASLDSMVVGEPQILGQVKEAYSVAREAGAISTQLEMLLQSAFAAAKKVRTETAIGSSAISIASVAVDLAQKIFGTLTGKTVFLVGAGKMSELAARHLVQQGADSILLTNRTASRAEEMAGRLAADFPGSVDLKIIPFDKLNWAASKSDIVIASTGSPTPIFRPEQAKLFLSARKNRPMFFIDIAVPRDVDPAVNKLEGIFLYDIDDMQSVAATHLAHRSREAANAEHMIEAEVDRFQQRLKAIHVAPAIVHLQQQAEQIRLAELQRMESRISGLTAEQHAAVEALTRGLVNKFLHPAMTALKQAARAGDSLRIEALYDTYAIPNLPPRGSAPGQAESAPAAVPTALANTPKGDE